MRQDSSLAGASMGKAHSPVRRLSHGRGAMAMAAGGGAGNGSQAISRGSRKRTDAPRLGVPSRHILATTAAADGAPIAWAISADEAPADHSRRASAHRTSFQNAGKNGVPGDGGEGWISDMPLYCRMQEMGQITFLQYA